MLLRGADHVELIQSIYNWSSNNDYLLIPRSYENSILRLRKKRITIIRREICFGLPRLALDYCAQTRSSVSPRNNVPCLCSVKLDVICYLLTTTVVSLTGKLAAEAQMDNPLRLLLWFPSRNICGSDCPMFLRQESWDFKSQEHCFAHTSQ